MVRILVGGILALWGGAAAVYGLTQPMGPGVFAAAQIAGELIAGCICLLGINFAVTGLVRLHRGPAPMRRVGRGRGFAPARRGGGFPRLGRCTDRACRSVRSRRHRWGHCRGRGGTASSTGEPGPARRRRPGGATKEAGTRSTACRSLPAPNVPTNPFNPNPAPPARPQPAHPARFARDTRGGRRICAQ